MANCQISKAQLRQFEKMQVNVSILDAQYLVGKIGREVYKTKRNVLKKRFEILKKRLNKC